MKNEHAGSNRSRVELGHGGSIPVEGQGRYQNAGISDLKKSESVDTGCIGQNIIESAMDAIIVIDEAQNIAQFNASAEGVFGYAREEVLGKPVHILLPEHLRKSHRDQIRTYGETGMTTRTMHALGVLAGRRADGTIFPLEASLTHTSVDGRKFFAVILRDISQRENLEKLILRQYESLNTLHLITIGLLNRRNIKDLLQFIVDETVKLLDVSYCEILLPEGDELVAKAFTHQQPFAAGNRFKREAGSLSWRVFDSRLPVVLEDYSMWPHRHRNYEEQEFHAAAAIPLLADERCIGVLGLTRERPGYAFNEEQVLIATRLADIAALAIENSRLYLEVQRLATVDELTGVHNRRSLMGIGEIEVERAIRYRRPFSVLMLDIDHFKQINDTWGHAAGDAVLHGVAQEAVLRVRKTDAIGRFDQAPSQAENVIGRLGGEEFGILLPETSSERAWNVAQRLRTSVEKMRFDIPGGSNGMSSLKITISVGVASLDQGSQNLTGLFSDADRALYLAKESGRNKVCMAEPKGVYFKALV